jgi:hypothetical protein
MAQIVIPVNALCETSCQYDTLLVPVHGCISSSTGCQCSQYMALTHLSVSLSVCSAF